MRHEQAEELILLFSAKSSLVIEYRVVRAYETLLLMSSMRPRIFTWSNSELLGLMLLPVTKAERETAAKGNRGPSIASQDGLDFVQVLGLQTDLSLTVDLCYLKSVDLKSCQAITPFTWSRLRRRPATSARLVSDNEFIVGDDLSSEGEGWGERGEGVQNDDSDNSPLNSKDQFTVPRQSLYRRLATAKMKTVGAEDLADFLDRFDTIWLDPIQEPFMLL